VIIKNILWLAVACLTLLSPGCVLDDSAQNGGSGERRNSSVKGVSVKPVQSSRAAGEAFRLVNDERARRGARTLTRRPDLDAVAHAHARDLMRMNRLSHVSSDGRQLENRLARLDWEWAGENLARNKGYDSPAREAVKGWINSPKHYENMFRADFTQTGMAALYDPASGFTYFVQVFITPVE
jgi:uncharacterized protein YkwD